MFIGLFWTFTNPIPTLSKCFFQLESGSCLGAVKLSNFIPWDIDIDIGFATADFHHFKVSAIDYERDIDIEIGFATDDFHHFKVNASK